MSQPNPGQDRFDYRETADITEVHASVLREHAEPKAGTMPIPTWLGILGAGALCWAGAYVGMFHGGFSSKVYNEYESSPVAFFPLPATGGGAGATAAVELNPMQLGEKVYKETCQSCHGANGMGAPGSIPALAGSEWVVGSEFGEARLAGIVLKGLQGPITVKGNTYNGNMTPWATLGPKKLAAVLTYVRNSWGNQGSGFTPEQIKAATTLFEKKSDQFTEAQLKQIPTDQKLEGGLPTDGVAQPVADVKSADPKPADAKPADATSPATFDLATSISNGKGIYATTCGTCHQPTGLGMAPAFPPLAGVEYVTGDPRRLIAISIKGVTGPMKVLGKDYVGMMPSPDLTFPVLKDNNKMADVLNYVRNSWGNKSDVPVTPELIDKVRKEFADRNQPWTEQELLNFPAGK